MTEDTKTTITATDATTSAATATGGSATDTTTTSQGNDTTATSTTTDTTSTTSAGDKTNTTAVDDKTEVTTPGKWPENWQEELAGEDKKALEQLKRYATPVDLAKGLLAAKEKLRTGGYKEPLPKDPTPEQLATWRKDNNIPVKPEDYKIELADGYIIGEDEKPQVDKYIAMMHEANTPQDIVNKNLNAYFAIKEERETQVYQANDDAKNACVESLKQEWGPKYQGNINSIVSFVKTTFGDSAEKILKGFGTDHIALMNDPKILSGLLQLQTQLDPAATVTNANNPGTIQSINEEIASIEKFMREDRNAYFKDQAKQDRYGQLLSAREKMTSK